MGRAKRFFKCPIEQMKIDGDNQAPTNDPRSKIRRHKKKSDQTGKRKQDPICTVYEFIKTMLNFHLKNIR